MESQKVNVHELNELMPSTVSSVVALAISGSKKSKYVIRWAFENLIPEEGPEKVCFKLLHVFPAINFVPTPMGGGIPISQVREDIAVAYRKEVEFQTQAKLLPYKLLYNRKKVHVEVIQVESDNMERAIADEIDKGNINRLVVGASSGGLFSRGQNLAARISGCCPGFCTIYVVFREKLESVRPSDPEAIRSTVNDANNTSSFGMGSPNYIFNSQPDLLQSMNQNINRRSDLSDVRPFHYISEREGGSSNLDMHGEEFNTTSSRSWTTENTANDRSSSLNNSIDISPGSQDTITSKLHHLRMELRHVRSRANLKRETLPDLQRLTRDTPSSDSGLCPFNHFICPILKDVMNEPCVAADGYTYDKKAMEEWLVEHDTSPVTNFPLMNKNLIPNYTILSAIIEWKSGNVSQKIQSLQIVDQHG